MSKIHKFGLSGSVHFYLFTIYFFLNLTPSLVLRNKICTPRSNWFRVLLGLCNSEFWAKYASNSTFYKGKLSRIVAIYSLNVAFYNGFVVFGPLGLIWFWLGNMWSRRFILWWNWNYFRIQRGMMILWQSQAVREFWCGWLIVNDVGALTKLVTLTRMF